MHKAKLADGTEITPEAYLEHVREIRNQRTLIRAQNKRDDKKTNTKSLPQANFVYCGQSICQRRVHLTNIPSAEGQKFVHQDPSIPALNLWFSHFGAKSKHAAHPKCPDYHKDDPRYAHLSKNEFWRETKARVTKTLTDPANVEKFRVELENLFGKRPPGVIDGLISKATKTFANRAILMAHPELFTTFIALRSGAHPHTFERSGKTHKVIYRSFGEQKVNYVGVDQNPHTYSVPKYIQLYFKNGVGSHAPTEVKGWRHDVAIVWNRPALQKSNDNPPPASTPSATPAPAQPSPTVEPTATPSLNFEQAGTAILSPPAEARNLQPTAQNTPDLVLAPWEGKKPPGRATSHTRTTASTPKAKSKKPPSSATRPPKKSAARAMAGGLTGSLFA